MQTRTTAALVLSSALFSPTLFSPTLFAQSSPKTTHGLEMAASCGTLRLTAIAPNAIRVRCSTVPSAMPELIYTQTPVVDATTGSDAGSVWIRTAQIQASVDKQTQAIHFYDANHKLLTEEVPNGRLWTQGSNAGDDKQNATGGATVTYRLQPGEHLYGSGQFQDGFLDIARLPRKLVQLNTQISIPFFLSNKGYGLLWHEYSLTELNRPQNSLSLSQTGEGKSVSADVTTSAGTQRQVRQSKRFEASFDAPATADYALQLESGRVMTDRWQLTIDDQPVIDFKNFWLPGTTSTITHLSAGPHHVTVEANGEDHPSLLWGQVSDTTTLHAPASPGVDYTVFAGNADAVISSYRALTGGTPMFPKWAFGFIQCRERYHSSDEILDTLKQFRKDQLPLDLIVQDWQYWGKYGWNAMRFDDRYYPDPAKLVHDVHEEHAHLMVSVWSRFDPASDVGKKFTEHNFYIPGTTWVDFFNPAAAQLYWTNFSTRMRALGIDAWWLDATEPENDDLHGRTTYAGPGDSLRLVYPLFVTKTVYEGSRKDAPDQRAMILSRSAFLGEQRYGITTWSGDIGNGWDTLKRQVTAGLDYSASGMPYWTTDTGGFFRPGKEQYTDPAYHERFLRWMEFSTFTPLLRVHGYQTNTEPWNYGPEMVRQQRQLLDLRSQLLPYLYTQAAAVTRDGGTMMRPLVMDFPDDPKSLDQKYEYMFGPSMLVAPVLDPGVTKANVYAPPTRGGWFDWWTGAHISGGTETTVDAPLEKIPLLIRAGSIVPLSPVQAYTGQVPNPVLELRIYPGADGTMTLYDDDGSTYAYEKDARSTIRCVWDDGRKRLTLGAREGTYVGMAQQRQFHVSYRSAGKTIEKEVNYSGHKVELHF